MEANRVWEMRACGRLDRSIADAIPRSARIGLTLLRDTRSGRRVVVHSDGARPNHVLATAFPELLPDAPPARMRNPHGSVRGVLRQPITPGGSAASDTLWSKLSHLEAAWFRERGALLRIEVEEGELRLHGYVERDEDRPSDGLLRSSEATERIFEGRRFVLECRASPFFFGTFQHEQDLRPIEIETARVAVAMGYYESPRRCTMEEIAAALGITKSAVFHRIYGIETKAVQRLVRQAQAFPTAPVA